MKTDTDRWEELLAAAATMRVRVSKLSDALGSFHVRVELARHIDVALRRLPPGPNGAAPPIEEVKDISAAITNLLRIADAAGVDDGIIDATDSARRALVRTADAFLIDTQVIT